MPNNEEMGPTTSLDPDISTVNQGEGLCGLSGLSSPMHLWFPSPSEEVDVNMEDAEARSFKRCALPWVGLASL